MHRRWCTRTVRKAELANGSEGLLTRLGARVKGTVQLTVKDEGAVNEMLPTGASVVWDSSSCQLAWWLQSSL